MRPGWLLPLFFATAIAGCATPPTPAERAQELVVAGFRIRVADTPELQQAIKTVPERRFIVRTRNGVEYVIFADPANCNCVYYGDSIALQRYRDRTQANLLASAYGIDSEISDSGVVNWALWHPIFARPL